MLVRTVRMIFHPDAVGDFMSIYEAAAPRIRAFPGCRHLELWRDVRYPSVLTTYSLWTSPDHLEQYRKSDLFRSTWRKTKPLFAAPPEAFSHTVVSSSVAGS